MSKRYPRCYTNYYTRFPTKNIITTFKNLVNSQFRPQNKHPPWARYRISLMDFYIGQIFPLQHVSHQCLTLSLSSSLPQNAFQTELSYSSVSLCSHKLGMGPLPQSLSDYEREPLALKIFPIMQTDKGVLFKSPEPIC